MNQYLCTINTLIIHVLTVLLVPRPSVLSKCTISKSQDHIGGVFFFSCFLALFLMACRFDLSPSSQKRPPKSGVALLPRYGYGVGLMSDLFRRRLR